MPEATAKKFEGRPPKFDSPEKLIEAIESYLNDPPKRQIVVNDLLLEIPCYTVTGLAYHLGFESRQSLYDYGKNPKFSYIIKKAKLFIEMQYEQNLHSPGCTGSIFALKNMGWNENQEPPSQTQPITINLVDAVKPDANTTT